MQPPSPNPTRPPRAILISGIRPTVGLFQCISLHYQKAEGLFSDTDLFRGLDHGPR